MGIDKIDRTKLSVDELAKLEQHEFNLKQVQRFKDIQGILEEVAGTLADSEELTQESVKKFGALLTDIRESLSSLNKKEAPESPDYAKPVVEELKKLEKELSKAIKGIDTKPQVNVAAPQVKVEPKIDLKGVEKVLKDMPSAFEKAIKSIPKTEIKDYSEEWQTMFEKLDSIDTASRMKPQFPVSQLNSIKTGIDSIVTNTGTGKATAAYSISAISDDGTYKYFFFEKDDLAYYIMRKTKATSVFSYTKGTGGYATVYVSSSAGPSGSPTWASYGTVF